MQLIFTYWDIFKLCQNVLISFVTATLYVYWYMYIQGSEILKFGEHVFWKLSMLKKFEKLLPLFLRLFSLVDLSVWPKEKDGYHSPRWRVKLLDILLPKVVWYEDEKLAPPSVTGFVSRKARALQLSEYVNLQCRKVVNKIKLMTASGATIKSWAINCA
jgi:hypothetical protein